jgi:hypothetical protein
MATYTKTGTVGRDDVDLFTISGVTVLPVNGDTYVFDGLAGTDTLTLSVNNSYPYLGYFLSTNFTIPPTPDAFGQYVITGTIMSDIAVTLKLTSVEQLVFAEETVSLNYPGSIDVDPTNAMAAFASFNNDITVTTNADSGSGSLRSAIEYLNGAGGDSSNTIKFALSGTILIDPNNPLPLITNPVAFMMDSSAIEVKLENTPIIDGISAVVLVAESNVAVTIPQNLTLTVIGSRKEWVLGSNGTFVLDDMAGLLNTFFSGGYDATQNYETGGIGAEVDVILNGNLSGKITVTSNQGDSAGIGSKNDLTIGGSVTSSAEIIVTGRNSAVGLGAQNGDIEIDGGMTGVITTKAKDAGGIGALGSVTLGALSGKVMVYGEELATGIRAESITINGALSGAIGVDASAGDAYGLDTKSGALILRGDLSGKVKVYAQNEAYGLNSSQAIMIGSLSGNISATSDNFALGLWAKGELQGTSMQSLTISGIVSADGGYFAAGIVAGGAMNLNISGTVSGSTI